MTETTKKIIIAVAVAAVSIAGTLAAVALIDDDDGHEQRVTAPAEEAEEPLDRENLLGDLFDRFRDEDGIAGVEELLEELFGGLADGGEGEGALGDRLRELFEALRDDLRPLQPEDADPPQPFGDALPDPDAPRDVPRPFRDGGDAFPFEGFGFRFGPDEGGFRFFGPGDEGFGFFDPGEGFFEFFGERGAPFGDGRFFGDGELGPREREQLERWLQEFFANGEFGFGFGLPGQPFVVPGVPFGQPGSPGFVPPLGDLPLGEFLEDGVITPDEARELERLFRERAAGDGFGFEVFPPQTDRAPLVPELFLDGLRALPFREFFADGELTLREREALRQALNEWLTGVFEGIDARG